MSLSAVLVGKEINASIQRRGIPVGGEVGLGGESWLRLRIVARAPAQETDGTASLGPAAQPGLKV